MYSARIIKKIHLIPKTIQNDTFTERRLLYYSEQNSIWVENLSIDTIIGRKTTVKSLAMLIKVNFWKREIEDEVHELK